MHQFFRFTQSGAGCLDFDNFIISIRDRKCFIFTKRLLEELQIK